MKDLINWQELSRILAGNDDSIRRDKIPKKYEDKVQDLLSVIEGWHNSNKFVLCTYCYIGNTNNGFGCTNKNCEMYPFKD